MCQNGKVLVDICGGVADAYERKPVNSDTLFCCFSVTKGIAAASMHLLREQGLLDFDTPIASYWPEFGCHGKENITVAHVLNHQSGFVALRMIFLL